MTEIKDESIFQGIVEFTGPRTGTRFRFESQGGGIYHRFAQPAGERAFFFDGKVRLRGGNATPERLLKASDLSEDVPHVRITIHRWWTNAPEGYDYAYVRTVASGTDRYGKPWRLIEVTDLERFTKFQLPRYQSGLKQAHPVGSADAEYLQLVAAA